MDWTKLGIVPTKDKNEIKKAYRNRLSSVNPEDKPEEFKALRAAYEEAMRCADEVEEIVIKDESPVGIWMEKVHQLYFDFASRIQVESWRELLSEEICVSLDTRSLIEEALLKFFMDDYHLPQSIWQLLDETFYWIDRKEELYEKYPKDFVDYVIVNGVYYPANLPYEFFIPGINAQDCDQYIYLYHQAKRTNLNEIGPILEQILTLSESHPYGQALQYQYAINQGQIELGKKGLAQLAKKYPDDITLIMDWATLCSNNEEYEECEKITRHVLEIMPTHWMAKRLLVDCLSKTNREEEAKNLLFELIHATGGDQKQAYYLNQEIRKLNEILIERWKEKLSKDPKDDEIALELGWCYLQNDQASDALAIVQQINPHYEEQYNYHNLFAKVCYANQQFEESLYHFQIIEQILSTMEPDGSEECEKRMKRLPEFIQFEGSVLYILNRAEEAREKYEQALSLAPDNPEILTQMANLLFVEKEYARAVEVLTTLTEVLPYGYHGYYLLAQALYEVYRDSDAFNAINQALELDGSDLGAYVLKMRILIRNELWEGVHDILDFIHQSGITDDLAVLWCKALVSEFEEKNNEQALTQYQMIASRIEEGENLGWASEVYYRMTHLLATHKKADRKELLEVLEKGLAYDPKDLDCLYYKAWLLAKEKRNEEAITLYHELEAQPNHSINVERALADLYYDDYKKYADKAYYYYQKVVDYEESSWALFYACFSSIYMENYQQAEKLALRMVDLDPHDVDNYRCLGSIYEALGNNEEALINANKAIEIRENLEGDQSRYYLRKIKVLRRLQRPYDALKVYDEIKEKYDYKEAEERKFDVLCQFGLFEEAQHYLDKWQQSHQKINEYHSCCVKLAMYLGKYEQARSYLETKSFDEKESDDLWDLMDTLEGNTEKRIARLKASVKEDGTYSFDALNSLAFNYWIQKDEKQAQEYALKVIEDENEKANIFRTDKIMVHGKLSRMYAILGNEEQARFELEKASHYPCCEGCTYCRCKDLEIYQAEMEEILGNYEMAMELNQEGIKHWPDELDFVSGILRLKKRGF